MFNLGVTRPRQITVSFILKHIYTTGITTIVTSFIPVIYKATAISPRTLFL